MKKRYRVTAPTRVLGVEPGEVFEREIDPAQEERLLKRGALVRVDDQPRIEVDPWENFAPEATETTTEADDASEE